MSSDSISERSFSDLELPQTLLNTLADLGYEAPSPIQAATIPALLAGRDVLGQAQTGTGKTAAFALPILARLGPASPGGPAALVLTPTRELAIQVAEAFHRYAGGIKGFHVLPIYGGQAYGPQLSGLRRGAHVVVGTPGRVIDHLNKGTLKLDQLQTLVLDEADEMLRMGFIDDVRNVLDRVPDACQVALFSATMPDPIRRIADKHLKDAEHVTIRSKTTTAASINQRYWVVGGVHKLDALTRILEVEPFDAMLVFARTRVATEELARRLEARGFSAAALNGDVVQKQREQIVDQLKRGEIDILVATDVAARGLDVERISHVVNYDIPHDTEAYVHRIGRTGRAGRSGEAIVFVAPRERNMLRAIERATRQPIQPMGLPTIDDVNAQRVARFQASIAAALESGELDAYREVVRASQAETGADFEDIAAALVRLLRGDDHLLLSGRDPEPAALSGEGGRQRRDGGHAQHDTRQDKRHDGRHDGRHDSRHNKRPDARHGNRSGASGDRAPDAGSTRYRIAVGHAHGVKPGNIVGAIANEAGLDSRHIGRVDIQSDYTLVDLPTGMPKELLQHLKKVRVVGQKLRITVDTGEPLPMQPAETDKATRKPRPSRDAGKSAARPGESFDQKSSDQKSSDQKSSDRAPANRAAPGRKPHKGKPDDRKSPEHTPAGDKGDEPPRSRTGSAPDRASDKPRTARPKNRPAVSRAERKAQRARTRLK